MNEKINELLEILLDRSAREDERHDAALLLFDYDDPKVEEAFYTLGSDKDELLLLLDAAGEGIGEISCRKGKVNLEKLDQLSEMSRDSALAIIKLKKPNLISDDM